MHQYLQKFLVLHRKLTIPQLGSFYIAHEPARLDADSGLLFAPKPVIRFSEADRPGSDKVFFHYLANEMQVDELAAIREFHDFCYEFRNSIQSNNMASLPGIGRIVKRSENELGFTPETNLLELLPPVPWPGEAKPANTKAAKGRKEDATAEEAVEEEIIETEEETARPDRWWIYALVLGGIGILALLYYYRLFASIL